MEWASLENYTETLNKKYCRKIILNMYQIQNNLSDN